MSLVLPSPLENHGIGEFPGVPISKTLPSSVGGTGSILGLQTKNPYSSSPKNQNIKENQCVKKSMKTLKMVDIEKYI